MKTTSLAHPLTNSPTTRFYEYRTKQALPRRTFLRGLGVSVALPLLDGMVPAFAALRTTAARGVKRLGAIYVPNGVEMRMWTPKGTGRRSSFR